MRTIDWTKLALSLAAAAGVFVAGVLVQRGVGWSVAVAALSTLAALFAVIFSIGDKRSRDRARDPDRVVVIYARQDLDNAKAVADWLRSEGFSPWLDVEQIEPGSRWPEALRAGIRTSGAALVLVTENLDQHGGWVAREIELARMLLRSRDPELSPIIPLLMDNAELPRSIRDIQGISFLEEDGKMRLLGVLRRVLSGR